MKGFCPICERETELDHIQKIEEIKVKEELIPVEVDRFHCEECGEEFDHPAPTYDPLAVAYREYRRRKGMVQPEEIRAFREKYNLTQKELSDLLGFGGATLSRYENGALQDETHNTILRLMLDPVNLQRMIEQKPEIIGLVKREQIFQMIGSEIENNQFLIFMRSTRRHLLTPSLLNGFQTPSLQKIIGAMKVLVFGDRVYKTKLNKLFFYADFKHFQRYHSSITGLSYAHLQFGPVPDQYELLYESVLNIDHTLHKEEDLSLDCGGEFFACDVDPGQAGLSLAEIQTLLWVKDYFKDFSSKRIVEFSHLEPAYLATQNREIISFVHAANLNI